MGESFVWHRVSQEEKEEISRESKKLLENFSKKLSKIDSKERFFENEKGYRQEGEGWETLEDFRDIMFLNAPLVEDEFIIAEKGKWK